MDVTDEELEKIRKKQVKSKTPKEKAIDKIMDGKHLDRDQAWRVYKQHEEQKFIDEQRAKGEKQDNTNKEEEEPDGKTDPIIEKYVWFYYDQGFSIIPLGRNKGFWNNSKDELKKPSIRSWDKYKTTAATKEEIQQWLDEGLFRNIGIVCGHVSSDLVIIDIDDETIPEILELKFDKILESGAWPSKTGRGYQVWMKHHNNPGGIKKPLKYKIEYRANNGYCVAPPSTHPNGKDYHFIGVKDFSKLPKLVDKDVKSIFDDFKKKIGIKWNISGGKYIPTTKTGEAKDYPECVSIALETVTKHPMRYYIMYGIASHFAMNRIPQDMAMKKVKEFNLKKCVPPHENSIVEQAVNGAYKPDAKHYGCGFWRDEAELCPYEEESDCPFGKKKARRELLKKYKVFSYKERKNNDTGEKYYIVNDVNCPSLAKMLLEKDERRYLIMKDNQDILCYNGSFYENVGELTLNNRINYYLDTLTTNKIKSEVIGFVKNTNYTNRDSLDQQLNIINLKNGIFDINTEKLVPHSHKYMFQYELPVEYKPGVDCPTWKKFIEDVLYQEDIPFVQEVCGFLLYRRYTWALITILLGHGRNGKTVFLNVMSKIMGEDNTEHIPLQTIAHERFAKAKLYQKHGNLCSELGAREIKDTGTLKQLTGEDMIFARELYKNGFSFRNFAKLMFACNLLPEIGDKTLAMNERIAVLEFPNAFERGTPECDPNITDKLTTPEEISGILNWMIDGLKRLLKNKKFSDYRNFENVADYLKQSQDPVNMFTTTYIVSNADGVIQKEHLYNKYLEFCKLQSFPTLDNVWFSRKFKKWAPITISEGQPRKGGHKTVWKGIMFKNDKDKDPTEKQQEALKC